MLYPKVCNFSEDHALGGRGLISVGDMGVQLCGSTSNAGAAGACRSWASSNVIPRPCRSRPLCLGAVPAAGMEWDRIGMALTPGWMNFETTVEKLWGAYRLEREVQ